MASRDDHLAQAAHNEDVSSDLALAGHFDWAVTALFYSAHHLVQASLLQPEQPTSHRVRARMMEQSPQLNEVAAIYSQLRQFSESARYDRRRFTQDEYLAVRTNHFLPIQTLIIEQQAAESSEENADG